MVDYITPAITQILTLLRSRTNFATAVKLGNSVTFTEGFKWPEKDRVVGAKGANDYPELKLRMVRSRMQGFTGRDAMKTFGNTAGGTPPTDFATDDECVFELMLIYAGLDTNLPDQLDAEMRAALFGASINLGLAKVKTWGPLDSKRDVKDGKLICTTTIPVTFRLRKADLIGV